MPNGTCPTHAHEDKHDICVPADRGCAGSSPDVWRTESICVTAQALLSRYDLTRPYFRGHGGKDKSRNITPPSFHFYMCAGKRFRHLGLWEMGVVVAVIFEICRCIWGLFFGRRHSVFTGERESDTCLFLCWQIVCVCVIWSALDLLLGI